MDITNDSITIECLRRLQLERRKSNGTKYQKHGEPFQTQYLSSVAYYSNKPVDLWNGLWFQGEIACLFGEPNVGKTLLAMQIANQLNKRGLKTLYFDFENAAHQMKTRYMNDKFNFTSGDAQFIIKDFNHNFSSAPHDAKSILEYIKSEIVNENAPVIIIDDINHILGSGDQQDVRYLLNTLRAWSQMFLVSILIIAHSKRRKQSQLTTLDSLSGSFELSYFFDSIFSLTRANKFNASHNNISHYIKQHKNRIGEIVYDDMNVITASMGRDQDTGMLQFNDLYTGGNERQLLRDFGFHSNDEIIKAILFYKAKFFSTREIADMVGCSQSQVSKKLAKYNAQLNEDNQQGNNDQQAAEAPEQSIIVTSKRIKLIPNYTPIFIEPKYGYDIYGTPIYQDPHNEDLNEMQNENFNKGHSQEQNKNNNKEEDNDFLNQVKNE